MPISGGGNASLAGVTFTSDGTSVTQIFGPLTGDALIATPAQSAKDQPNAAGLSFASSSANGTGAGGTMTFNLGGGDVDGEGGYYTVAAGPGGTNSGDGGKIQYNAGDAVGLTNKGGNITYATGNSAQNDAGDYIISLGTSMAGGRNGLLILQNMGTADPSISNAFWLSGGIVIQSGHTVPAGGGAIKAGTVTNITSLAAGSNITISGSAGVATIKAASGASPWDINDGTLTVSSVTTLEIDASLTLTSSAANTATLSASANPAAIVQQVTKALSSADILAMNTTPITVVAAPGAGFWLKPVNAIVNFTVGGTAYTGGTGANLYYGANTGPSIGSTMAAGFTGGTTHLQYFPLNTSASLSNAQVDNQALVMASTAPYLLGTGTAVLVVDYIKLPTP